ncbi:MAG TPA: ATP-binding protein [Candidatus Binataceae bacterium]|nr:ATP-binding protein [Candidatus Binataceae bacterium]
MTRNFDLNIEKILEGWETRHAVRELIANALDEQALSGTRSVSISCDADGLWTIRDYGRGLRYEHLTQNENTEKLAAPGKVIGKFGVGLKDALATLNRHGVNVQLRSRYCDITLSESAKHGFSDVVTLHAAVAPPSEPGLVGTEVRLAGITKDQMDAAREFFVIFSDADAIEETSYGQIVRRHPERSARIYVTGLLVAEEQNFAFSYNITSLTAPMRKALNRERTNVGRSAYTDRVKAMLLASRSEEVAAVLAEDLTNIEHGTHHDEVQWTDVALHACQILNASRNVVFVTASEHAVSRDAVDHALADGYQVVTIPENIKKPLVGLDDICGMPVRDLGVFQQEQAKRFSFDFVDPEDLSEAEQRVLSKLEAITQLAGGLPADVKSILISEALCPDLLNGTQTRGLWDGAMKRIIIARSQLASLSTFAGVVLHELTHARTGYADVTREFETALTDLLGRVASCHIAATIGEVPPKNQTGMPSLCHRLIYRE